jgi:hypothetical protein
VDLIFRAIGSVLRIHGWFLSLRFLDLAIVVVSVIRPADCAACAGACWKKPFERQGRCGMSPDDNNSLGSDQSVT